jgi:hypothetical protein
MWPAFVLSSLQYRVFLFCFLPEFSSEMVVVLELFELPRLQVQNQSGLGQAVVWKEEVDKGLHNFLL